MTFITPNHTNPHDVMSAELVADDLWSAFLQLKGNILSDGVLALDLKNRHGSADVSVFIVEADNKNSKRRETEWAAGACMTASNFQITCKWELFI